jgi:probable HAF family extracellular repeat protein
MRYFVASLVVLLGLSRAPIVAGPTYELTVLPTLGGSLSQALAINNAGQVTGRTRDSAGVDRAFLYSDGTMVSLGSLPANAPTFGYGINELGQVVGWAGGTGARQAALFSGGTVTPLGLVPGYPQTTALAINNSGLVAGYAATGDLSHLRPAIFTGGTAVDLTPAEFKSGVAYSVNQAGVVGGYVSPRVSEEEDIVGLRGFLYNPATGKMKLFNPLPGDDNSYVVKVNDAGVALGSSFTDQVERIVTFNLDGSVTVLRSQPFVSESASTFNNRGEVIESYFGTQPILLYEDGAWLELSSLVRDLGGFTLTHAAAINDSGQIVGYGRTSAGAVRGFLLTPVPEPGSLTLLVLGVCGLLGRAWRCRRVT